MRNRRKRENGSVLLGTVKLEAGGRRIGEEREGEGEKKGEERDQEREGEKGERRGRAEEGEERIE